MQFFQNLIGEVRPQQLELEKLELQKNREGRKTDLDAFRNTANLTRENSLEIKEDLSLSLVNVHIQSTDLEEPRTPQSGSQTPKEGSIIESNIAHKSEDQEEEDDNEDDKDDEEEEEIDAEATEHDEIKEKPSSQPLQQSVVKETIDRTSTIKKTFERHHSLAEVKFSVDGTTKLASMPSTDDTELLDTFFYLPKELTTEEQLKAFFENLKIINEEDVEDQMDQQNMDLNNCDLVTILCDNITNCIKDQSSHQARIIIYYSVDLLMNALQIHQENEKMIKKLITVIRDLTSINSILQIKFGCKEGYGKTFSFLLELYLGKFDITILICEVIRNIVIKDQGKVLFGQEGCCEALTHALYGYVHNPDAALLICGAILNISANSIENKRLLGEYGCCEPLVEVLLLHLSNPPVMKIVCGTIQNISVYDTNKLKFGEHGCCEALIHVLLIYMENPGITWEIFGAIRNVSLHEKNMIVFQSIGTLQLLTKALIMHMANSDVTRQVCGALRRMISFHHTNSNNGQAPTPTTITTLPVSPTVITPNLELIKQVWGKKLPLYERYYRIYNEDVICETLLDALTKYQTNADITREICATIKTILLNEQYYTTTTPVIADKTSSLPQQPSPFSSSSLYRFELDVAIPLLLQIFYYHTNMNNIQTIFTESTMNHLNEVIKEICAAINSLGKNNESKMKFYHENACIIFINAMQQHVYAPRLSSSPSHDAEDDLQQQEGGQKKVPTTVVSRSVNMEIVREIGRIIKNFALHEESKRTLGELGISDLLVHAIDEFIGNPETIAILCGAILNLSANNLENKIKFGKSGICEKLIQIIIIYLSNEEVLKQSCGAIKNISVYDYNKLLFHDCGGCNALIAAMTTHLYNKELFRDICEAIWNISVIKENQVAIGEIGGCEIILEAVSVYFIASSNKQKNKAIGATTSSTSSIAASTSAPSVAGANFNPPTPTQARGIVKLLIGILKTLAMTPANRQKIGSKRGCEIFLKLLSRYHNQLDLMKSILQLLFIITDDDEVRKQYNDVTGGEKLLLFFLAKNIDSDMILLLCKLLQQLTCGNSQGSSSGGVACINNRHRFYSSGCCEMITEILRRLPKIIIQEIENKYKIRLDHTINSANTTINSTDGKEIIGKSISRTLTEETRLTSLVEAGYLVPLSTASTDSHKLGVEDILKIEPRESEKRKEGKENTDKPQEEENEEKRISLTTNTNNDEHEKIQAPRNASTSSIHSTATITTTPVVMSGPEKEKEMKIEEVKKVIKTFIERVSMKDNKYKTRFEEIGTHKYLQPPHHNQNQNNHQIVLERKTSSSTMKVEGVDNLKPLANVVENYQKRQKFSDQRFENRTIIL
eukprot:gene6920-7464_t